MKKTLITFLALAGVAAAAVEGSWNGTINRTETTQLALNLPEGAPITLSNISSSITSYKELTGSTGSGANLANSYSPETNVGTGNNWTLTFTITNDVNGEALYLTQFYFDTFTFTSAGAWQANERTVTLTLAAGENVIATGEYQTDFNGNGTFNETAQNNRDTSQTVFIDTGAAGLKLEAGESITLSLTASCALASSNYGTYVGLTGATVRTEYIPEPATATLSLLALCGLAARRRRCK